MYFFSNLSCVLCFLQFYVTAALTLLRELFTTHRKYKGLGNLSSKSLVAVVTGGAKGIGLQITREFVHLGIYVIIGSHCKDEAEKAIHQLRVDFPKARADYLPLDLSSLSSVRQFADSFKKKDLPLHILINNAGIMLTPYIITEDGLESQFSVNYMGHFLLTHLLLDVLKESGTKQLYSRIVNTSSAVHYVGKIQFENLQGSVLFSSHASYAQSKLAVVLFTYELQRRLSAEGCFVTVNSVHPGVVNTDLYKNVHYSIKWILLLMAQFLWKTPEQGADTTLYTSLSPELEGRGGLYLDNSCPIRSSRDSYNVQLQRELWYLSSQLTHIDPTE